MGETISIETIILLDSILGFVSRFNNKLIDSIWKDFKFKYDKYLPMYLWMMRRNSDWWKSNSGYVGEDIKSEVKKIASEVVKDYESEESLSKTLNV
jgi:hypothetical protein